MRPALGGLIAFPRYHMFCFYFTGMSQKTRGQQLLQLCHLFSFKICSSRCGAYSSDDLIVSHLEQERGPCLAFFFFFIFSFPFVQIPAPGGEISSVVITGPFMCRSFLSCLNQKTANSIGRE